MALISLSRETGDIDSALDILKGSSIAPEKPGLTALIQELRRQTAEPIHNNYE